MTAPPDSTAMVHHCWKVEGKRWRNSGLLQVSAASENTDPCRIQIHVTPEGRKFLQPWKSRRKVSVPKQGKEGKEEEEEPEGDFHFSHSALAGTGWSSIKMDLPTEVVPVFQVSPIHPIRRSAPIGASPCPLN